MTPEKQFLLFSHLLFPIVGVPFQSKFPVSFIGPKLSRDVFMMAYYPTIREGRTPDGTGWECNLHVPLDLFVVLFDFFQFSHRVPRAKALHPQVGGWFLLFMLTLAFFKLIRSLETSSTGKGQRSCHKKRDGWRRRIRGDLGGGHWHLIEEENGALS